MEIAKDLQDRLEISHSPRTTQKLGEAFAKSVLPGMVICLFGDLGAGKTTFTKGFAKGLGISSRIISPTFTLVREHSVKQKKIEKFYHIDLYRLENVEEIAGIGFGDILQDKDTVTIIEWAEKLGKKMPTPRWEIRFIQGDNDERHIKFKKVL